MAINRNAPYFQAAKHALMQWDGFTPEEADKFIQEKSRAEVDQRISHAHVSLFDAAMCMGAHLGFDRKDAYYFTQEMLGLTDSKALTEKAQLVIEHELAGKTLEEARAWSAKILIASADATHGGWVESHADEFWGKKDVRNQRHQFMSSDFIGFPEVKSDFLFIAPMAEKIGLPIDEQSLLKRYHDVTIENLREIKKHGVEIPGMGEKGPDTIRELVGSMDEILKENAAMRERMPLPPHIAIPWEHDDALLDDVTQDVVNRGICQDDVLMQRLIDENILNRDNPDGLGLMNPSSDEKEIGDDGPVLGE